MTAWWEGLFGLQTVQEEGTDLTQRSVLNFIGDGVTAVDNPSTGAIDVTIPGVSAGGGTSGDWRDSVRVATTTSLPAYTRVGDVITADANGALPTIDGVTLTVGARRVLLWHGASSVDNGTYDVTALGDGGNPFVLTRTIDGDGNTEGFTDGTRVPIAEGTAYGGKVFAVTSDDPIILNTDAIAFAQDVGLPAGTAAGQVLVWDGAAWTGDQVDLADTDAVTGKLPVANVADGGANTVLQGGSPNTWTSTPSVVDLSTIQTGTADARGVMAYQHNDATSSASFSGWKSRGTPGAPTAVANGDYLAKLGSFAYADGQWNNTGFLAFYVADATPAANDVGTGLALNLDMGGGGGRANRLLAYPSGGKFHFDFLSNPIIDPGYIRLGDFTGAYEPTVGAIRVGTPSGGGGGLGRLITTRNLANSADRPILDVYSSGGSQYVNIYGLDALTLDASSQILFNAGGANALLLAPSTITSYRLIQWTSASTATLKHLDAAATTHGTTTTVQAQSAVSSGYNGGPLALKGGAGVGAGIAGPVEQYAGSTKVASLGAHSTNDYIAFGADPADSGAIRWSHGLAWKGEPNTPGTDVSILDWGVSATDTITIGDTSKAAALRGSTVGISATGAVELQGANDTMLEAVEIAAGRRVVSLALGADLTTTQMPSGTGDLVIFVGSVNTTPTAAPVGGGIIYFDGNGNLHVVNEANVDTQLTP